MMAFARNFNFNNNEIINDIFDQQIYNLTEGKIDMGILETIKMQERREGKIEGRHEEALEIAFELKKEGLAIAFIAKMTKLKIKEVEALV